MWWILGAIGAYLFYKSSASSSPTPSAPVLPSASSGGGAPGARAPVNRLAATYRFQRQAITPSPVSAVTTITGPVVSSANAPSRGGNPGTIIRAPSLAAAQHAAIQMGWNPASVRDLGSVANPLPGMTMGYPGSSDHWYELRQF